MGLRDPLIEPCSILKQHEAMYIHHPELAFLKAFPKMGHIDFTLGDNGDLVHYLFEELEKYVQK